MNGNDRSETSATTNTLYEVASSHWVHGEQMRWTILYNFLVGNTILLVAWATLFVGLLQNRDSLGLKIVLIASCALGALGGIVWALLESRANGFAERFFNLGVDLEKYLPKPGDSAGPFGAMALHRTKGFVKTYVVLVVVPVVFAVLYVALLVISIFAASGRL